MDGYHTLGKAPENPGYPDLSPRKVTLLNHVP